MYLAQMVQVSVSSDQFYAVLKSEEPYSNGLDCSFIVEATPDFIGLDIIVEHYNLEGGYDFLTITEPESDLPKVARLSGDGQGPLSYQTGPKVTIRFTSDYTIYYEGFKIFVRYVLLF